MACKLPPPGWRCSREEGHDGPCAALQVCEHCGAGQGRMESGAIVVGTHPDWCPSRSWRAGDPAGYFRPDIDCPGCLVELCDEIDEATGLPCGRCHGFLCPVNLPPLDDEG